MRRQFVLGATALLVFGAWACGSKDTGPSFNGTISDSAAVSFAGSAADFVSQMFSTYQMGSPNIEIPLSPRAPVRGLALLNRAYQMAGIHRAFTIKGRPAGSAPLMRLDGSDCGPVISGDTLDDDGDGIPNNAKVTVACTTIDSVAHDTTKTSIVETIADVPGIYGFIVNVAAALDDANPTERDHLTLNESEHFTVTSARDDDNVSFDLNETATPVGGSASGGQVHYNWNSNFTPAEGLVLEAASPPDGNLAFSGGFFVTSLEAPTTNFSFGMSTTTPLVYSAECGADPQFIDGTVTGHLNGAGNNIGFTVTYTGCGVAPTITGQGNATATAIP
ncbi:MAG: hypothetical protein ACREL2_00635 [Gemmatimonadales bacterium]